MVRRTSDSSARAFTLIELLVAISIIAVLLGILLPTIAGVRSAARKASTQSLMRNVRVAIDAFQADTGRAPGYFSAQEMGNFDNAAPPARGFTAMENALLELTLPADSVQTVADSDSSSAPSDTNTFIDVGPHTINQDQNVRVNVAEIGTASGGSYLSIGSEHLRAIEGQISAAPLTDDQGERVVTINGQPTLIGMPDIIDYFGQPIMLWQRDTSVQLPATEFADSTGPDDAVFASLWNQDAPQNGTRAAFYWASNAGYLSAGSPTYGQNEALPDKREGLGEQRINQAFLSCIGERLTSNPLWVSNSLMGALGAPAFPNDPASGELPVPIRARGDIILHSAGPNKVFFERGVRASAIEAEINTGEVDVTNEPASRVGYAPREAAKRAGVSGGSVGEATGLRTPDEFDDLLESTGG